MRNPTTAAAPAPAAPALAPIASLGLTLVGCPDCRAVIGIDGAPGLAAAVTAHRQACPAGDEVCPGCGCEALLHPHGDNWLCGDCLGERLFDPLPTPAATSRRRVRAVRARPRHTEHEAAVSEAEPAEEAVA